MTKINYINEITNPPAEKRIKSLGFLWLFIILFSIVITRDAILLVKEDMKLQRIFDLAKSLKTSEDIDKKSFLAELSALYEDYYNAIPWALVTPKELVSSVSEKLSPSESIGGRYLEIARTEIIKYVRYGNLYSIRSMNIFTGPLLFGFCLIRIFIFFIF